MLKSHVVFRIPVLGLKNIFNILFYNTKNCRNILPGNQTVRFAERLIKIIDFHAHACLNCRSQSLTVRSLCSVNLIHSYLII